MNEKIFEIEDQGIGIPEKDMSNLFDSFYRASNVGNIQGSGMGLTIVAQFIKLHGGEINIESELNKGTKIVIEIPIK